MFGYYKLANLFAIITDAINNIFLFIFEFHFYRINNIQYSHNNDNVSKMKITTIVAYAYFSHQF